MDFSYTAPDMLHNTSYVRAALSSHALQEAPNLVRQCTVLHTARSNAVAQNAEHGETTSRWQIYDDPSIYDRVFAEREFEEEVSCLPHGHALQIKLS